MARCVSSLFLVLGLIGLGGPLGAQTVPWQAYLGRGDRSFEGASFAVTRSPGADGGETITTTMPATGAPTSTVRVDLDARARLVRSRTEYLTPELASWYRADLLLTEVQPGAGAVGGDNLAFQRAWKNEVQDAKNLAWGPDYLEFSTLPFVLEARLAAGDLSPLRFKTYFNNEAGAMEVTFVDTDRPLALEGRYDYPRFLRERFDRRPSLVAVLGALGDFKGGYPYPFYYAFSKGPRPTWVASWGGNPRSPTFQWRLP